MSISSDNFYNAEDQYKEFYGISGETDIGDDTKDTFIPTEELNDSHYKDLRILTEANEKLKEEVEYCKGIMEGDEDLEERLKAQHQIDISCLKEEIKELKLERQRDTIAEVRSARDRAMSENKKLQLQNDVLNNLNISERTANMLLRNENKCLKEENEKLAETADENPDCCVSCDTRFNLHYTMNHCDAIQKGKYDDYFGSEKDQGDLCPDCINTIC